eukprot:gene27004-33217_t
MTFITMHTGGMQLPCGTAEIDFFGSQVTESSLNSSSLTFSNVASVEGKTVDLVVTKLWTYKSTSPDQNTVFGKFGTINLHKNSSTSFNFNFVYTDSGEAAVLDTFYMSFFGISNHMANIKVAGFDQYVLPLGSLLRKQARGDVDVKFHGPMKECDPFDPMSEDPLVLSECQLKTSLSYLFSKKSTFSVKLAVGVFTPADGINFYFAGSSQLTSGCGDGSVAKMLSAESKALSSAASIAATGPPLASRHPRAFVLH